MSRGKGQTCLSFSQNAEPHTDISPLHPARKKQGYPRARPTTWRIEVFFPSPVFCSWGYLEERTFRQGGCHSILATAEIWGEGTAHDRRALIGGHTQQELLDVLRPGERAGKCCGLLGARAPLAIWAWPAVRTGSTCFPNHSRATSENVDFLAGLRAS